MPISNELVDFTTRYYLTESLSHVLSIFGTDCILDGFRFSDLVIEDNTISFTLSEGQFIIDSTLINVTEPSNFSFNVSTFADNGFLVLVLSFKYLRTARPNFASFSLRYVNALTISENWNEYRDRIILAKFNFNKINSTVELVESSLSEVKDVIVNNKRYEIKPYSKILRNLSFLLDGFDLALLNTKVDKIPGKSLTSNDFTNEYKQPLDLIGLANGIATLNSNGKVPLTQIDDSILGQLEYMGLWNPVTNEPLLDEVPDISKKGHYYVASTDGIRFGLEFAVGDWIISNGTYWAKLTSSGGVTTVNGRKGNVVITRDDLDLGYIDTELNNRIHKDQSLPANLSFFMSGELEVDTVIGLFVFPYNMTLNVLLNKSKAYCLYPASNAAVVYYIRKNSELIGTVTFEVGLNVGVFSFNSSIFNFVPNDVITIVSQSQINSTFGDVSILLACTYSVSTM